MRLFPSLLSLALLSLLTACAASRASAPPAGAATAAAQPAAAKAAEAAATAPATATVSIPVAGMHCGGCVRHVTAALQAVDGVVSAETRLDEKRAIVTYAPARVAPAALVAAIRETGYEPGEPTPSE